MRFRMVALLLVLPRLALAQATDTTRPAPGTTVSGVVRDSLARVPLAGAAVQLVPADGQGRAGHTATSDSLGRYAIDSVPDGRYMLGFFHPLLDSLGVESPLREVTVAGRRPVRADLATPSPARLRAAICSSSGESDSGAVLVGVVRDARDHAPVEGASVRGEWAELTFTKQGIVGQTPRLVATTGANGWFAMCGVPRGGTMTLRATHGADDTDLMEIDLSTTGFQRRELYVGASRTVGADSAGDADSVTRSRRQRVGDGRLSGTVIAEAGGRPLAGAQVGIVDGPQARANERGEWSLADAPAGTRMLEVRAVGFYPERRRVDVVAGAPPVRVQLFTLRAMLDTVKVRASRLVDRHRSGFEDRRRTSMGRFIGADQIARMQPNAISDMFRSTPGVRVTREGLTASVLVRGIGRDPWCAPTIFLNGKLMRGLTADDVDG